MTSIRSFKKERKKALQNNQLQFYTRDRKWLVTYSKFYYSHIKFPIIIYQTFSLLKTNTQMQSPCTAVIKHWTFERGALLLRDFLQVFDSGKKSDFIIEMVLHFY